MKLKIDHVNMSVKNLKESVEWYEKIFGFKVVEQGERDHGPWAIVANGDSMICMYQYADLEDPRKFQTLRSHQVNHFGLRIADPGIWEQKIKDFQIPILFGGVQEYPHSLSWYLADPTGHEIEVSYSGNQPLKFDVPLSLGV